MWVLKNLAQCLGDSKKNKVMEVASRPGKIHYVPPSVAHFTDFSLSKRKPKKLGKFRGYKAYKGAASG